MRWLCLLAVVLALAACGPLPRPFQPETKGDNELLLLPDRTGIAVSPATGLAPAGDGRLAAAMAEALRKENVPASVGAGNSETHWLLCDVQQLGQVAGVLRLRLTWELYDADGAPVGSQTQTVAVGEDAWRVGAPDALDEIVRRAAPRIAAMIQGPAVRETELAGYPPGTRVVVDRVTGEPAAAARALTGAMTAELRERRLPLADRAQPGDVVVTGRVTLGEPEAGARPIEVVWTVGRAGENEPLGDLRQANSVPQAQLDQGWPRLGGLIAQAAAPGVLQVLAQAAPRGGTEAAQ